MAAKAAPEPRHHVTSPPNREDSQRIEAMDALLIVRSL
jgi:hypothetical protein